MKPIFRTDLVGPMNRNHELTTSNPLPHDGVPLTRAHAMAALLELAKGHGVTASRALMKLKAMMRKEGSVER
jgi:hypothetical protein